MSAGTARRGPSLAVLRSKRRPTRASTPITATAPVEWRLNCDSGTSGLLGRRTSALPSSVSPVPYLQDDSQPWCGTATAPATLQAAGIFRGVRCPPSVEKSRRTTDLLRSRMCAATVANTCFRRSRWVGAGWFGDRSEAPPPVMSSLPAERSETEPSLGATESPGRSSLPTNRLPQGSGRAATQRRSHR